MLHRAGGGGGAPLYTPPSLLNCNPTRMNGVRLHVPAELQPYKDARC